MPRVGDSGGRRRAARAGLACALLVALALPGLALAAPRADRAVAREGCANANADASARGASAQAMGDAVVCLVDHERARYHLPPLLPDPRLALEAQRYSSEMARRHFFGHTGPRGSTPGTRIAASGYRWSWFGENIASGLPTPFSVFTIWMRSRLHCRNLLAPVFLNIGIGVVATRRSTIWTDDLALPRGELPPSGNWGPAKSCPHAPGRSRPRR